MNKPLADRIRPSELDDVVGQRHLLEKGKALRSLIDSGDIPNLIFYGPSGVGKTTVASIIASKTNRSLRRLNGTTASTQISRILSANLILFLRLTEFCFILMKFSILIKGNSNRFLNLSKTER